MEMGELSLVQHASSLLLFVEQLHSQSLFTDLKVVCEDGVVDSYRYMQGSNVQQDYWYLFQILRLCRF